MTEPRKIDPIKEKAIRRFERTFERMLPLLSAEEKSLLVKEVIMMIEPKFKTTSFAVVDLADLLLPANKSNYTKISVPIWNWLQEQAKINLEYFDKQKEKGEDLPDHETVEHWANIRNGIVPFGLRVEKGEQG